MSVNVMQAMYACKYGELASTAGSASFRIECLYSELPALIL